MENGGTGEGGGEGGAGWGGGHRQRNRQINAHAFVKSKTSDLPFCFSLIEQGHSPVKHGFEANCTRKISCKFGATLSHHSTFSLNERPRTHPTRTLVHRIAAFAFAFAMAIPRCQWRHRCVVTLGKFLVVLYSKPLWRKGEWKQRRKGDVRDAKNYHRRC